MSTVRLPSVQEEFDEFIARISAPTQFQREFYLFTALFTEWMDRAGIAYFLHSGSALGAVRHKGFIPWDDDMDVMVEEFDEAALVAAVPELERYGVRLNPRHNSAGHYQFSWRHPKEPTTAKRFLSFDIFIGRREMVDERTALHYKNPNFRQWYPDRHCFVDDVYPRRRQAFGPLQLWTMRDPTDYFRRSGFRTDEAIVAIHMFDQDWLKERISYFKQKGLYPIRDKQVLQRQHTVTLNYPGLDAYRLV